MCYVPIIRDGAVSGKPKDGGGAGLGGASGGGGGTPGDRWGQPTKRVLIRAVALLPYIALCSSVLALGLIAGFLLASPLAPQVPLLRKLLVVKTPSRA